jgi:hypothetical protein
VAGEAIRLQTVAWLAAAFVAFAEFYAVLRARAPHITRVGLQAGETVRLKMQIFRTEANRALWGIVTQVAAVHSVTALVLV